MTYSILFTTKKLQTVLWEMGVLALLLAIVFPWLGRNVFARVERFGRETARYRWRAILVAAAFPMLVRFLMLPVFPVPLPVVHDEFSYLLQGDTFARGRVTNPTPPFPEQFEAEYVILNPTYASQYQPLPGVFLALGEVIFRNAWFGVWIATGLMCGAFCWALLEVLPAPWALFGALAAALQFGIFGFWMNSYFGGSVAAIGGALVFGGLARLRRFPSSRLISAGAFASVGIVILMASRPVEGFIWSGIALIVASRALWRSRVSLRPASLGKAIGVTCAILFAGALSLAVYNSRVTGDPLVPPYLAYRTAYGTPQSYWWQPPIVVTRFANAQLRDNFTDQYRKWAQRDNLQDLMESTRKRLRDFWRFFIGPLYTPCLAFLGLVVWNDRRIRWAVLASIPFILDHATYHAWYPQQTAPATILIVLIFVQCWRHMRAWMRRRRLGFAVSRNLTFALASAVFLAVLGKAAEPAFPYLPARMFHWPRIWEPLYQPQRLRDDVTAMLEAIPGKHLLLVKYAPDHCFCEEWVFNSADIRNQQIVYAREGTPESDAALATYLGVQDVWRIEPDRRPYLLAQIVNGASLAEVHFGKSKNAR